MTTPFDILGVGRTSSDAEIKSAYRKKAKELHPDANPNDPQASTKFQKLNEAYEQIRDGKSKSWRDPEYDPFHTAKAGFGNQPFTDINDLMRNFQENMRKHRGRNEDIGVYHSMSLEEAYTGKTLRVEYNLRSGHKTVEVIIPPGVDTGTRLHVPGKGQDNDPTLPSGDLYVNIQVLPHADVSRNGLNLIYTASIDIFTAILGGEIEIKEISGRVVRLAVPKGTASSAQLRVVGHGMPAQGLRNRFGDMLVAIHVAMPKTLNADQLTFIEAARDAAQPSIKRSTALASLRS